MEKYRVSFQESADRSVAPDLAAGQELRSGEWVVAAGGYALVEPSEGSPTFTPFISAVPGSEPFQVAKEAFRYSPLLKHVDLFSHFARLAEAEIDAQVALEWANDYGVLGLTPIDPSSPQPGRRDNPLGGERDTVENFATEASLAHRCLRLYEAAMSPKGVDTATIAAIRGSSRTRKTSRRALREKRAEGRLPRSSGKPLAPLDTKEARDKHLREVSDKLLIEMSPGELAEWSVNELEHLLWIQLAAHTYPQPYRSKDGSRETAWGFRNLLGAMWLQMLWLWEQDYTKIRRCQWCGRVIEHRGRQARNCEGRSCRDKHSRRGLKEKRTTDSTDSN